MKSKTKNSILLISFIGMLVISYKWAFSKTLSLYDSYNVLKTENILFENMPKQQYLLIKQNRYLDSLLNKYQIGGTSLQNNLLKSLNANADTLGFKLVVFNETHLFKKEQLEINSHVFTVEGKFDELLKLINNLEQKTRYGEIVHLHFQKKKDLRTRKERLEARVIVQHY
tara:strand:- start:92 stop:601 length:510 start_codon:yes stop_codon:yes gene_type:complete